MEGTTTGPSVNKLLAVCVWQTDWLADFSSWQWRLPLLINPSIPHLVLRSTEGPEQQGKSIPTESSQQEN